MNEPNFGVPVDPPEEKPILKDYYGDDVYENSTVYINQYGLLLENNLERYTTEYVDELTAAEAHADLQEVMRRSEYEELMKESLLTWISENGYAKFFDMTPKVGGDIR